MDAGPGLGLRRALLTAVPLAPVRRRRRLLLKLPGAAVLLWRSDVQEWYYPALREGITHVTIDSHNVARTVVELKKDDKAARRMAIEARNVHENHLCPSCLLEHWTYVLTKYNSRFGLRFLDLPATLALLDAKARGEVAVGV